MQKWKLVVIFSLFLVFSLLIITKLFYLQIKKGEYYEALALGQQISFSEVDGERGGVFFSNGNILAKTQKKIVAYITPQKITDIEKIFAIFTEELSDDITKGKVFKREITEDQAELLQETKGVTIDNILTRFYPQNDVACHVVGFTNEEGKGQYGIEAFFNEELEGEKSFSSVGNSPFGFFTSIFKEEEIKKGTDIYLTLNENIQYFAEKLLKKAKQDWDMDSGQIIVMDPKTGKVLALVNSPSFNLNEFFKEKSLGVFLNSSLQKLFEPGSVLKPFVMAAGLEEGLIDPETEYIDEGSIDLGGPFIYNFEKRIWGKQTMTDVLEESINTGAVFVEQKLGKETFLEYLDDFGFFEKTGIELQGEIYSRNESLKRAYERDVATASFGQGIEITPIQLVKAFSALANGGLLMEPHIIEKVIEGSKETIIKPKEIRRVISETVSAKLTAMLVSVVRNGAGRRAQIPGYYITGKTGTAQVANKGGYSEYETIQSFIGYFPALNPKALIFVRLDNPKGVIASSYSATPIFKELAKFIIDLWQIPPTEI